MGKNLSKTKISKTDILNQVVYDIKALKEEIVHFSKETGLTENEVLEILKYRELLVVSRHLFEIKGGE